MPKRMIIHYGIKYRSGRYPYGSGEDPFQHDGGLRGFVKSWQEKGKTQGEIAEMLGMGVRELRSYLSIESNYVRSEMASRALKLKDQQWSNAAIAKELGVSETTVKSYLDPIKMAKKNVIFNTADAIKYELDAKGGYLDVGEGNSNRMRVSADNFDAAVTYLRDQGYEVHNVQVPQAGTGFKTIIKVLAPPGTTYLDIKKNLSDIHTIGGVTYTEDSGRTVRKIEPPVSVNSSRVKIRYNEEGGIEKDGVIEIRRGVEDLSLGNANYVQARIAVDGTHYLKGMCIYSDAKDWPDGVDIVFNTNKHLGTPMTSKNKNDPQVLKPLKSDESNPFGAVIKMDDELILAQRHYTDKDGKEKLSAINVVSEEGNWGEWSKTLSSQFLSKQSKELVKRQLDVAFKEKKDELAEIQSITNPVIRSQLLLKFADSCDSAAVDLKGASLPRQQSHVILPFPSLKPDEIYAPNYEDGEKVVLIRHPHGGTFELPELTVNNHGRSSAQARKTIGNAKDAVGINAKVAEQLSGADFDGDTVIVIPNNNRSIITSRPLKQLEGFDPKELYGVPVNKRDPKSPGYIPRMTNQQTQNQMGRVSNLITDMQIKGAPEPEIARAIKHSMVVIDAEKHYLDWRQSEKDNGIAQLKEKWQGGANRGASTIVSRASSEVYVNARKQRGVDKETGAKKYIETGETMTKFVKKKNGGYERENYVDENGNQRWRYVKVENGGSYRMEKQLVKNKSTRMAEATDAYELVSGSGKGGTTAIETLYAQYANNMKELALSTRKDAVNIPTPKQNESAKKVYAKQIESLRIKVSDSKMNKPLEREAQRLANEMLEDQKRENPGMSKGEEKKHRGKNIMIARQRVGSRRQPVEINDKEWEAINAGACSAELIKEIIAASNLDALKARAMPRESVTLAQSKKVLIRSLANAGYTQAEIADRLGISTTLVSQVL